ncbi:MAG: low molecular weight phosphotyrosine protein phosphatase [Oscillospiraceae bacterium]|nr:low molecular weight phosphotyrosine protein phosphatase [Oscillospiraceae bacterium]
MIKVLFICHGNICRSPMAEFIMKKLVNEAGIADKFDIASAATSSEELGNPVYPPARRKLAEHGIGSDGKTARRITAADYAKYDLLIGMDNANMRNMNREFGGDSEGKLKMLMDYTSRPGEVSDPWYTGDFERAYRDIDEGCRGLLADLRAKFNI